MAQYHFQVRTGTYVFVTESVELAGATEARIEAARRVGVLLSDHAELLWADTEWRMDVTDGAGLILLCITIIAERASAKALPARPS